MTVGAGRRQPNGYLQIYSTDDGASYRWRLLGANNRDLARGRDSADDAETCRLALKHLVHDLADLRSRTTATSDGRWRWELVRGREVVAESTTSFDRKVRCAAAASRFLRLIELADIPTGSVSFTVPSNRCTPAARGRA